MRNIFIFKKKSQTLFLINSQLMHSLQKYRDDIFGKKTSFFWRKQQGFCFKLLNSQQKVFVIWKDKQHNYLRINKQVDQKVLQVISGLLRVIQYDKLKNNQNLFSNNVSSLQILSKFSGIIIKYMKRQKFSKLSNRTDQNSQPKKQLTLEKYPSKVQLPKLKHRLSRFCQTPNNSECLKQRNNNTEDFQILDEESLRFIFGKIQYDDDRVIKHLKSLHQGLLYSTFALGSPSGEYLKQKKVFLPQDSKLCVQLDNNKKFLILDLDQTLIHSVEQNQNYDVEVTSNGDKTRFNIRPFCEMFLDTMSQHFQIYVFTSALQEYAEPIVAYLNSNKKYIKGLLTREHCLETKNGLRIKDLRIIENRDLSQIVIIDNLVHCFGLQLQNGIPILQFTNQKNDRELLGLQKMLIELKKAEDVRVYLRDKLALKKCLEWPESHFTNVKQAKSFVIRKQTSLY